MTLGQRVRSVRRARKMTQRELAGGTLSESFISMIEHDKVRPSLETLELLARRLDVPAATFLGAAEPSRHSIELELRRCEALLRQHRFTDALEGFSHLAALVSRAGGAAERVRCELGLGQALAGTRQMDLAEPHLRRAYEDARGADDPGLLGAAANAWGFLCFRARRFALAQEILQDAATALEGRPEHGEQLGKILANLGRVYVELGLPVQAMRMYGDAAALLGTSADPSHRALLHFNMGIASERQRAFEQAQWHFDQALELFRLQENLHLLAVVQRSIGILRLAQGAAAEAVEPLEHSLHLARQVGDDEGLVQTMVELARARVRSGDPDDGRRLAGDAARVAHRIADPLEETRATVVLAEADAAAGSITEARGRLRRAIEAFQQMGATGDLAQAHRILGELLLRAGKPADAAPHLARALELTGRAR
ncbi:MAG: helix-turn-helix domain-containing protein [bacterium]